jgi:hypothetical protein
MNISVTVRVAGDTGVPSPGPARSAPRAGRNLATGKSFDTYFSNFNFLGVFYSDA